MTAFSFSYSPKASTALASINPLKSGGEGLRFAANTPMSFLKQNPEIVTEGFWKGRQALTEGIVKGVTSALSGVSGALTSKAAETKADTKLAEDRAHEIAVANIKSAPTAQETAYQQQRSDLLAQQIDAAKEKAKESLSDIETAPFEPNQVDFNEFSNLPNFNERPAEVPVVSPTPAEPVQTTPSVIPATPTAPAVSQSSIFGKSTQPNFVAFRDAFKNRSAAAAPTEPNLFSDISAVTPAPIQEDAGYSLADVQLPQQKQRIVNLPKPEGEITLNGATLPLERVEGAEGTLAGVPPVEPALPQAVPTEPALAATPELTQPVQLNEDQYRYEIESKLTGRPYRSPADANMAKKLLEQKLGVKAQITAEKGDKGSRIYHVEVIPEEASAPAKIAPEGYYTESIRDADGKETYVYKPKVPVKQQIATFDNGIKKANVLKETLERIKKIAPSTFGITGGAGGISGLMKYNPIANDARTTRALLDTVKGIVGFDELVALKAQGGSLGALSDSELKMLTSLQGSIDPDMDEKTFMDNINKMSESTEKLIAGLEEDKKQVTNVEKKTNFQPIQSEQSQYQKGVTSFVKDGYKYVWDGTEFKLSK